MATDTKAKKEKKAKPVDSRVHKYKCGDVVKRDLRQSTDPERHKVDEEYIVHLRESVDCSKHRAVNRVKAKAEKANAKKTEKAEKANAKGTAKKKADATGKAKAAA